MSDTTDQDPTWCTVRLYPTAHNMCRTKQCEHADAKGRYVVEIDGDWHGFDPPTKIQALAWINSRKERQARIRWLCFACGEIMPLGDQAS